MKNKILFFGLLVSSVSQAWTITQIVGAENIKLLRAGTASMVAAPKEVEKNDILFSGNAKVLLTEGASQVWMAPKTYIKVASLRGTHENSLTLDLGKVRIKVAPPEAQKWHFETKSVVAGVRGTEFFITTNPDQENWCVIEGKVEAKLDGIDPILIPAGEGAQLRADQAPRKVTNNSFQVEQWKAEISEDETSSFMPRFFQNTPSQQKWDENWSTSFSGLLLYKENYNKDYDNKIQDQANLTRLHLYPSINYKNGVQWTLTPRLSFVGNQPESIVDQDSAPPKTSNQNLIATVAEASASFQMFDIQQKWGVQKITLAEQSYLSDAKASPEPITHVGVTAKKIVGTWDVNLALTSAQEGQRPGDGMFPHGIALIDLKNDSGWMEFYALRVDSKSQSDYSRTVFHQTLGGLLLQDRGQNWEYKLSKIFQSGTYQATPSAIPTEIKGGFLDATVAGYLGNRSRLFVRYMQADSDYIALAPAAFYLGLSPALLKVSNLKQLRYGVEYKLNNRQVLVWEHLQSDQISDTGLVNMKASGANSSNVGEENDFFFRQDINEANKLTLGFYRYTPHWLSSNSDPSWGVQIFALFGL